uniref:Uncharacterized protein n=1 Tax=Anguilla anguilla TaxID=7936 RepID=A0A0E9QV77_ANGAN
MHLRHPQRVFLCVRNRVMPPFVILQLSTGDRRSGNSPQRGTVPEVVDGSSSEPLVQT